MVCRSRPSRDAFGIDIVTRDAAGGLGMPSDLVWPIPAGVILLTGPAQCGKTERLLALYRQGHQHLGPGECLWLAPTSRSAAEVRGQLVGPELPACLSPGVMTFDNFASSILRGAAEPIRPIGSVLKRQLLQRLVAEAHDRGELDYFGPIADTAGFIDLLADFISDLKRHEVWPDVYTSACRPGKPGRKDRELALLYERYQDCLNRGRLYDAEGRFWWARTVLRDDPQSVALSPRMIIADGFTDFTHTQHEILEVLAARAEWLLISLPLDEDEHRIDLFHKTRETLAQLRSRHPQLRTAALPRSERRGWPAFAHVESQLFRNPREQTAAAKTDGIQIGAVAGQLGELRWIARTIKQLLIEGDELHGGVKVRPGDVAVVCRGLQTIGPLVAEVFEEYGLPLALEVAPTLDRVPALALMLSLVQLEVDDWPLADLLAVISNTYFRPTWPSWRDGQATRDLDWIVRELQIPAGRELLHDSVARAAAPDIPLLEPGGEQDVEISTRLRHQAERIQHARASLEVIQQLIAALGVLPEVATAGKWSASLQTLATEVNFEATLGSANAADREAWQRLLAALEAEDQLSNQLEQSPRQLDRHQFLRLLADLCRWEKLHGGTPEAGRVRVLSAPSVRGLKIPYLFFAGLSESSFPQHQGQQFHLPSEVESLRSAGMRFDPQLERAEDEMLLFYEVLTRATRRLYLSYVALDESAQRLLPSPYLTEIERACGTTPIARDEVLPLVTAIPAGPPLSPQELRVKATAEALDGSPKLLGALLQIADSTVRHLATAWRANAARVDRDAFSSFEGVISTDSVRAQLVERYGRQHRWSASDLEQYAYCPYRFLLERVLKIEPLADLRLDIDAADRGRLLHAALTRVYRDHESDAGDLAVQNPSKFRREFIQAVEELAGQSEQTSPLSPAWQAIDRQVLIRWCDNYLRQAADYAQLHAGLDEAPRPAFFEVSFGLRGVASDGLSSRDPLKLELNGQELLVQGRIDRVDLAQHGGRTFVNIVDYKSGVGKKPGKQFDPTALQADLYAVAAAELLFAGRQAIPLQSGYWYLRGKGYLPAFSNDPQGEPTEYAARRQELLRTVMALAAGPRHGEFPVSSADDECTGRCAFRTVCRVNQIRGLEKRWQHPPRAES